MQDHEKLKAFGAVIGRLIRGEALTRDEAREAFRQVLLHEQPEMQQGAFLAALTSKGEQPEEIAGAWDAIMECDTVGVTLPPGRRPVENCGTGMDGLKTFNISTAASVVAAAGGVTMARHGARAITSTCGTVDVAEALGVDVECPAEVVVRSIETAGLGLFNGMSRQVHPGGLHRILSQIRFGSTLNIAASLANPARPVVGLRGVYSADVVLPTAQAMREIGYERALVVHGRGDGDAAAGMDEWSVLGETVVAELSPPGRIECYTMAPEDLGVSRGQPGPLRPAETVPEEARRLVAVLSGNVDGVRADAVCLNAGPLLWLTGQAASLEAAVEEAREILAAGRALDRLERWVAAQTTSPRSSVAKLAAVKAAAAV